MNVAGWIVGIAVCVFLVAFLLALFYFFGRLMAWLWSNVKAGRNPFPGVTPWRGFWIWRLTEPGSRGDIFNHPHGHHHESGHDLF